MGTLRGLIELSTLFRLTDEMDEGMPEFSFLSDDLPRIEWNVEGMAGPPLLCELG